MSLTQFWLTSQQNKLTATQRDSVPGPWIRPLQAPDHDELHYPPIRQVSLFVHCVLYYIFPLCSFMTHSKFPSTVPPRPLINLLSLCYGAAVCALNNQMSLCGPVALCQQPGDTRHGQSCKAVLLPCKSTHTTHPHTHTPIHTHTHTHTHRGTLGSRTDTCCSESPSLEITTISFTEVKFY